MMGADELGIIISGAANVFFAKSGNGW